MDRILIVEDDSEMAKLLAQSLNESGFSCLTAPNGRAGMNLVDGNQIDLVLADVMMPAMDGFTMVAEMRKRGVAVPVIFLTAKDQTRDLVHGLEMGADDYLVKPFKLEELIARIKAHLRRHRAAQSTLSWSDLVLDADTRQAFRAGRQLFLSATEFTLLELFMRQPDVVLPKQLILKHVWHDETGYRAENIVELYVNYLRRKTESHGDARVIQTVRGQGYVLANSQVEP